MKRKTSIMWGILCIAAALLLILEAIGTNLSIPVLGGIPIMRMIVSVILLYRVVYCIVTRSIYKIFFPLAFIFMLLEAWIASLCGMENPNIINNWLLLLCALLLTVGVAFLFLQKKSYRGNLSTMTIRDNDATHFQFRLGDYTKYIDCSNFKACSVSNKLGETNIYFENLDAYTSGGTLYVENSLGELCIHVPAAWNVNIDVSNTFGEFSSPFHAKTEGPILNIVGSNSLGETCIIYG